MGFCSGTRSGPHRPRHRLPPRRPTSPCAHPTATRLQLDLRNFTLVKDKQDVHLNKPIFFFFLVDKNYLAFALHCLSISQNSLLSSEQGTGLAHLFPAVL